MHYCGVALYERVMKFCSVQSGVIVILLLRIPQLPVLLFLIYFLFSRSPPSPDVCLQ